MKTKFLAAQLALCASLAQAAPPSTASIDAMLEATHADRLMDAVMTQMQQNLPQMLAASVQGRRLNEAQQRVMAAMPAKMMAVLREELSWDKLRPMQVQIYQEVFTQEEIDALTAFYRSPAGTALIERMPAVMQRSMTLMQARMVPIMQKMQVAAKEAIDEAGR